ncbi:spore coat protein domain-containing protein [Myxococcus stipitatus DSM 14675]|uniref:Spore coat protein domain-containing protein n=1 Tax=Myxococcus stipitatus (strain DSM 14675 / JCM 12634 / Mx s8) TaxID=1278073 RepID=L7U4N1_MYXSD|nr:spore coat U domain-containing protein [Myxococcus stipitatus]AGC43118.1 spore coat protein domain-containing protein [Myxococcus stipitatus DSM 14675]
MSSLGVSSHTRAWMLMGANLLCLPAAHAVCRFQSTVGPSFGVYTSSATFPLDTTGSITYRCDAQPQLSTLTLDLSAGGAGSYFPRKLQGPSSNRLNYNLYLDATRLLIWGNGSLGTVRYGPVFPVNAVEVTVPIYGRIPAGQAASAGAYSDTLVITMTF